MMDNQAWIPSMPKESVETLLRYERIGLLTYDQRMAVYSCAEAITQIDVDDMICMNSGRVIADDGLHDQFHDDLTTWVWNLDASKAIESFDREVLISMLAKCNSRLECHATSLCLAFECAMRDDSLYQNDCTMIMDCKVVALSVEKTIRRLCRKGLTKVFIDTEGYPKTHLICAPFTLRDYVNGVLSAKKDPNRLPDNVVRMPAQLNLIEGGAK